MTPASDRGDDAGGKAETRAEDRLITLWEPDGVASEAYRTVRTSLLYSLLDDPPRIIAITSAGPQEGKSTTSSNLAVVLAQADKKVALLDCDLRRSTLHEIFGVRNLRGVVDALAAEDNEDIFWHEPVKNLKLLTAGSVPPNPSELLGSERFARFLVRLREEFDYVLLDAPPVQLVSDPITISAQSDGVLVVIDAQSTRKVALRRSVLTLQSVGARVIGTLMNNVKAPDSRSDTYTYTHPKS